MSSDCSRAGRNRYCARLAKFVVVDCACVWETLHVLGLAMVLIGAVLGPLALILHYVLFGLPSIEGMSILLNYTLFLGLGLSWAPFCLVIALSGKFPHQLFSALMFYAALLGSLVIDGTLLIGALRGELYGLTCDSSWMSIFVYTVAGMLGFEGLVVMLALLLHCPAIRYHDRAGLSQQS